MMSVPTLVVSLSGLSRNSGKNVYSMKQLGVLQLPLDGMLSVAGSPQHLLASPYNLLVPSWAGIVFYL